MLSTSIVKRAPLIEVIWSARVKGEDAVVNLGDNHLGKTLKTVEEKEENTMRDLAVPFLNGKITRRSKESLHPERS